MLFSALALVLSVIEDSKNTEDKENNEKPFFDKKGWTQCASLIGLMVFYGATLETFGFIPATIVFLNLGYLILGERRPKVLFIASVPVVIVFWAIMTQLLGIYLSTGELWS